MLDALIAAAEHALRVRGTVLLEPGWCAICASTRGDLELRVGEPRRRKHKRWLEEHEFTHRVAAWTRPLWAGAGPGAAAEHLVAALEHAFDLAPDTALREDFIQVGFVGDDPPPADAPHREHLAYAFTGLTGRVHIEVGRPARPLAWIASDAGELLVEVEADGSEAVLGRYRDPAEAADALAAHLQADTEPLFIALLDS